MFYGTGKARCCITPCGWAVLMMDCPCKGCADRYVKTDSAGVHRCHSDCQKYANYSNQLKKQAQAQKGFGCLISERKRQQWGTSDYRPYKRPRQSIWVEA